MKIKLFPIVSLDSFQYRYSLWLQRLKEFPSSLHLFLMALLQVYVGETSYRFKFTISDLEVHQNYLHLFAMP